MCINAFIYFYQIRPENFHYLTRIHYADIGDGTWGEHEIDYILFLQKNVDLHPNPSEVSEISYIKRADIDWYFYLQTYYINMPYRYLSVTSFKTNKYFCVYISMSVSFPRSTPP